MAGQAVRCYSSLFVELAWKLTTNKSSWERVVRAATRSHVAVLKIPSSQHHSCSSTSHITVLSYSKCLTYHLRRIAAWAHIDFLDSYSALRNKHHKQLKETRRLDSFTFRPSPKLDQGLFLDPEDTNSKKESSFLGELVKCLFISPEALSI